MNTLLCTATLSLALAAGAADAPKPVEVRVARVTQGDVLRYVALPGTVKANQQAVIYAKVPGYLKSLSVDKGDSVKAGQSLGEIEVPELAAELARNRAELKVAETDYRRISGAQAKAPDLVVPQSVDDAAGKMDIAKANLARTETLLAYAKLTAPFNGVVTARFVDPGAFIPAATGGSAPQTAAIITLMDFATVRVQVAVPELEASLVRKGQPVKVLLEGLPGRVFDASVSRFSFALDDLSKTMLVEADLPNPDLVLRPGMYATARIGLEKHTNSQLVPSDAIVMEKAAASVFRLVDNKAKKTPVKIGFNDGTSAEILEGAAAGDTVIVPGKNVLTDGQAITVMEAK